MSVGVWQLLLIFLVFLPYAMIYKGIQRTGHSGWWVLFLFVPLINMIMLYILAFKAWPIEEE
ncbi:MAG: hypothetical protein KDG89_04540 [Geminicoccaceae bacterium]|nr:hypothetical protein [Geminicoccaceae bacterium]